jgi:hypothetical protein
VSALKALQLRQVNKKEVVMKETGAGYVKLENIHVRDSIDMVDT